MDSSTLPLQISTESLLVNANSASDPRAIIIFAVVDNSSLFSVGNASFISALVGVG